MNKRALDVAVIGAGPYGLSLAAHLRKRGVEFRIFGEPMESWKKNMPEGMLLKSYPWASNISDPEKRLTLANYFAECKIPYHNTQIAVPVDVFIKYGEAFQQRLVPMVEHKKLVSLAPAEGSGFIARFDDEEIVIAKSVVLAVGIIPFAHIPQIASDLPAEFVSHSSAYGPLDALDGKKVIVVGSGSSATDLAALLHERGTEVSLMMRANQLAFADPPPNRGLVERMIAPDSGIGFGWTLQVFASAPWLINRALPDAYRVRAAHTKALGPLGGAFMKDRVIGKVPLRVGQHINSIERRGGQLDLRLTENEGLYNVVTADHVVFATGFVPVDLNRLRFLDPSITNNIRRYGKAPKLSAHYESSVPGLYFIGPASMYSFGPVPRFVFGTPHPGRHLARYLAKTQEILSDAPEFVKGEERVPAGHHNRG